MNNGDCYLYIESDKLVHIINNSNLKATLIYVKSSTIIHLDKSSCLDTNGTANKEGKGFFNASSSNGQTIYGASNAG